MGTSIVIALPLDADQIKDTVIKAQQAGTTVVLWGVTADYDTILVQTDQEDLGTQIGNMALAWLDQAYPNAETGSIPTAIMGQSSVVDVIKRTEAVTNTVAADSRINITIEFDNCQDDINDGFIRMEEAMTVSPDLILVTNNCVANAVGNNNYVMAQQPDKAQNIGIFCADYDSTLDEIFPLVESGGACLRGTIQCGETPQASLVDCIDGIINGEIVSPYVVVNQLFSYVCPTFNYSYDARTI